jgi:hypothetical protein
MGSVRKTFFHEPTPGLLWPKKKEKKKKKAKSQPPAPAPVPPPAPAPPGEDWEEEICLPAPRDDWDAEIAASQAKEDWDAEIAASQYKALFRATPNGPSQGHPSLLKRCFLLTTHDEFNIFIVGTMTYLQILEQ